MISETAYWMGRDSKFRNEWTDEIQRNGRRTVAAVNPLLERYRAETGVDLTEVSSGWRPVSVNDATAGAGHHSNHIVALACDVKDPSGRFPRWCARNLDQLEACDLYMEDWHWTLTWCHLQPVPPRSGKTMYWPFSPARVPPAIPLSEKP